MKISCVSIETNSTYFTVMKREWQGRVVDHIKGAWLFIKRYSETVLKIGILLTDINFLVGKTTRLPTIPPKGSLIILNALGVLSWVYNVDWILKDCQDVKFGYKMGSRLAWMLASINVAQSVRDFFLTVAGTVASVEGLKGNETTQGKIYNSMRSLGFGSILMGLVVYGCYFLATFRTYQQTNEPLSNNEIRQIFRALRGISKENDLFEGLNVLSLDHNDLFKGIYVREPYHQWDDKMEVLAANIRLCMDKDTLARFIELIKQTSSDNTEVNSNIFDLIKQNLHTQLTSNLGAKLILIVLGSVLLGVERYYTPNSVVSVGINTALSAGWAFQSLKEKYTESKQRKEGESQVGSVI
jgi:hypothetical protein